MKHLLNPVLLILEVDETIGDSIDARMRVQHALAKAMYWEYIEDQKKGSCYDFSLS
tara:strand:+ start:786 stop:953 length:168 start_codon:yes stop_codon:yes gene_type:complete